MWWSLSCSASLSSSKEGSFSCRCTMTSIGVKIRQKPVTQMLIESPTTLADSIIPGARMWTKNGMRLTSTKLTESGIWSQILCCPNLLKASILSLASALHWKEDSWKAKKRWKNPFTSTVKHRTTLSHNSFRQSAHYLRSSRGPMWGVIQRLNKCRETCCSREFGFNGDTDGSFYCSLQRSGQCRTGKLVSWVRAKNCSTSWTREIDQTLLQCWFLKTYWERTILRCIDDGVLIDDMKVTCREYTLPRSYESSRTKRRIRGNTKIGPVLNVKISYHKKRYGVVIMIESSFGDKTVSWVRIMSGINKYVTETAETIPIESIGNSCARKPAAGPKAKPSSHVTREINDEDKQESDGRMSIAYHERQWIDNEPAEFSQGCLEVSMFILWLNYCDTIRTFVWNEMEQWGMMICWQDSTKSFPTPSVGQWDFNIVRFPLWNPILPDDFSTSERSRDTQEEQ